jgi:hypothetical protein
MGRIYDNPKSFGWLPPALQNEFIKAGHNKYAFSDPGKDSDQKVQVTKGNKRKSVTKVREINKLRPGVARKAIRQGNEAVKKERPVIAARVAKRQAVQDARKSGEKGAVKAARQAGRKAVSAARFDPNSARSEARAKRGRDPHGKKLPKPTIESGGGFGTPGAKGDKGDPGDSGPSYDRNPDAKGPASRSPRDEGGKLKNSEAA